MSGTTLKTGFMLSFSSASQLRKKWIGQSKRKVCLIVLCYRHMFLSQSSYRVPNELPGGYRKQVSVVWSNIHLYLGQITTLMHWLYECCQRTSKICLLGYHDGSTDKGITLDQGLVFNPWNSHGGAEELVFRSCPLTTTCRLWYIWTHSHPRPQHAPQHTHMHSLTHAHAHTNK